MQSSLFFLNPQNTFPYTVSQSLPNVPHFRGLRSLSYFRGCLVLLIRYDVIYRALQICFICETFSVIPLIVQLKLLFLIPFLACPLRITISLFLFERNLNKIHLPTFFITWLLPQVCPFSRRWRSGHISSDAYAHLQAIAMHLSLSNQGAGLLNCHSSACQATSSCQSWQCLF